MIGDVLKGPSQPVSDGIVVAVSPHLRRASPDKAAVLAVITALGGLSQSRFMSLAAWEQDETDERERLRLRRLAAESVEDEDIVLGQLTAAGMPLDDAVAATNKLLAEFRGRLECSTWWEHALVQVIGYSALDDVLRIFARGSSKKVTDTIDRLLPADDGVDYLLMRIPASPDAGEHLQSLMALWGRRIIGEVIVTVRSWLTQAPPLRGVTFEAMQVISDVEAHRVDELEWLLARVTADHARRMGRLGLAA